MIPAGGSMLCSKCQSANPDGAKFCMNCGASLTITCPKCATALPPGAKFCFNCGHNLAAQPPVDAPKAQPETQASGLHRFIPNELLAKLEAARAQGGIEGERRIMSMLFCDVKGSTAAAGQMDPEEWAGVINGAFEQMIRPIYQYEGIVARLMGDGLLAFFGAPVAHEDDPQRAILAGLGIVAAIRPYAQEIKRQWGIDLDVRVGINTGLVVVGAVGSDLRMEYTALGDAINLAARMEQTAQPGTVQIAEPIYRLVAPLFDFEVLENVEVKGKAAPVRAYRVLGAKAQPGSLRGIAGLRSQLVGRAHEVGVLQSAIERLQVGEGSIISVMGEAGLGKSRLVAELRDALAAGFDLAAAANDAHQLQWLEGRSRSYETNTPFSPFIDLLSSCFGLDKTPGDAEQYAHLKAQCELLFPARGEEVAPFLASLLGLAVTGADAERIRYLEPPMLRGQIFAHVTELVARLAQQPLVLFLDDLHWVDPTSLDLLEALIPLTQHYPLLLLAAFRPRRLERSWRFHESCEQEYAQHYTALALQPLDEEQSRQLVANLLYVENLPETVRRLILDKAEGNPFFVEEVIRSLLDNGLVVYADGAWRATEQIVHIDVPTTLVGVITARLDRLDDNTRRIVQAGAVLGREFIFETLADLYDAPELLEEGLAELQRRDMVREKGRAQHRLFAFKHVLTQEAAYNSILLSRRRELHRRAAASLVVRQPDRPADIAHHFIEARQQVQAVPYLVQAGDQATRNYASTEAMGFYRQVLELREIVEETALLRRAYEGLGNILALTGQLPEALAHYQAMLAFAESRNDTGIQVSALNKLAAVTALRMGQFAEAEPFLSRVERVAHEHDDALGIAEMSVIRCQMCTVQADFDAVVKHMGEVTAIGERLGSKEYMAMGLEHVASSLAYLTRYDEAETMAWQGLAVAREVGDREHEAWLLAVTLPLCLMRRGDFARVREVATEGAQMAARIGSLMTQVFGNWMMAELARWQGDYEEALRCGQSAAQAALPIENFMPFIAVQPLGALGLSYLEISPQFMDKVSDLHLHALRLLEAPGGSAGGGSAWADMGWCALTVGELEFAAGCFEKGLRDPSVLMLVERPRHMAGSALLASKQGRRDDALMWVEEACAYTEKREMHHMYPLVRLTSGRIHAAFGEHGHALSQLAIAENFAERLQMRPLLWQTQAAAASSLDALGRHQEAAQKRQAAQAVIQEIAGFFHDDTLRQAYLSQHSVN